MDSEADLVITDNTSTISIQIKSIPFVELSVSALSKSLKFENSHTILHFLGHGSPTKSINIENFIEESLSELYEQSISVLSNAAILGVTATGSGKSYSIVTKLANLCNTPHYGPEAISPSGMLDALQANTRVKNLSFYLIYKLNKNLSIHFKRQTPPPPPQYEKQLLDQIIKFLENIRYLLSILRRQRIKTIQLQYIAKQIYNRLSLSFSPRKQEPPIGGIKIGGELHCFSVMLPRYSTLTQTVYQNKQRNNSPISLRGT